MKRYTVAVVGATGMVGRTLLAILEERTFPVGTLRPLASARSAGKTVRFCGKDLPIAILDETSFDGVDIALFSAGSAVSERFAPIAAQAGAVVIDNTSHFRYQDEIPLVVPEVNREAIFRHRGIIANPNCSTAQLVLVLAAIHRREPVQRMVVSTYQSVSGAGYSLVEELHRQTRQGLDGERPQTADGGPAIAFNVIPRIDRFLDGGQTKEEMKMLWETHKILGDESIGVCCTCVRVPVNVGHAESVNLTFQRPVSPEEIRHWLGDAPGVVVMDDPKQNLFPTPATIAGSDPVAVGRIRQDTSHECGINLWVVADNLRKGAALNAVQIAEEYIKGP